MSGFEVAGIILGALPLIVTALESYTKTSEMMHTRRAYTREVKLLARGLETERVKLQNICEQLLIGIALPHKIEEMIEAPGGKSWEDQEIDGKIRQRLWKSSAIFEGKLEDIDKATKELKLKLQIDTDSQVNSISLIRSKTREFRKMDFVLHKSEYHQLLARVREDVSSLETLTNQNVSLEPERRKRMSLRLHRIMHSVSDSIHQALRTAVSACQCPTSHNVGLKLVPPVDTGIIPGDDDMNIVKTLSFNFVISYGSCSRPTSSNMGRLWGSLVVKPFNDMEPSTESQSTPSASPEQGPAREVQIRTKKRTVFAFADERGAPSPKASLKSMSDLLLALAMPQASKPTSPTPKRPSSHISQTKLLDMCETFKSLPNLPSGVCCGHITGPGIIENSRVDKYGVYPLGNLRANGFEGCSLVPLRVALAEHRGSFPFLLVHEDKLRLAFVIASSVLQLTGTPWLSDRVTLDDVFLVHCDGTTYFEEPFVIKQLPEPPPTTPSAAIQQTRPMATVIHRNYTLFYLGILLIEIMLETPFDTFRPPSPQPNSLIPNDALISDHGTAMSLLSKVNEAGGPNYLGAVERCIKCKFPQRNPNLGNDNFQMAVYDGVVARLEKDLQDLRSGVLHEY
ncbi:hypothetical protein QBC45DRAFT_383982 [Copromyces sp. CBS 386.78]|nr:hypothetical protein QBC45DRAFT_383982 [Copromyces sp. CBS 386.78]